MNCILIRDSYEQDGVFGRLFDDKNNLLAVTLEHAYLQSNSTYAAKVPLGEYKCARHPPNRLKYVTFMVQNVPPFQGIPVDGILIHRGNYNKDSIGCILLGAATLVESDGTKIITSSAPTFNKFMALQTGDEFTLTIKDKE